MDSITNSDSKKIAKIWTIRITLIFLVCFSFIFISLISTFAVSPNEDNNIEFVIKPYSKYKTTKWSGGLTREIAIYPENADYSKRDFIFRVSSATVDLEKSDFTLLPDYNRILMILSNKLDLTHNGGKNIHLNTFDQDYFDGADNTSSVGKVTDFNLMMRKGKCNGKVTHKLIKEKTEYILEKDYDTVIILAVDGELEIEGTKLIKLSKFDSLIVKKKDIGTKVSLSSITGTNVVITKIKY